MKAERDAIIEPVAFYFGDAYENRAKIARDLKASNLTAAEFARTEWTVETFGLTAAESDADTAEAAYSRMEAADLDELGHLREPIEAFDPLAPLKYKELPNFYRVTDALGNFFDWSTEFYRQADDYIYEPCEVLEELAGDLRRSALCVNPYLNGDAIAGDRQTLNLALTVDDDARRIKDLNN